MQKIFYILVMNVLSVMAYAQSISPAPGNTTVCPDIFINYDASYPTGGCTSYVWTVTNGSFQNQVSTGPSVSVKWNNTTAKGKLKVTV